MQLDQIFKMEFINADLSAKTKTEALTELVNTMVWGGFKLNSSLIIENTKIINVVLGQIIFSPYHSYGG